MTATVTAGVLTEIERALRVLTRPARLRRLHDHLNRKAGLDLGRAEYVVLASLEECGPMRVSDLAEHTGAEVSTTSRVVGRLQAAGLLAVGEQPEDRRVVMLTLTERGREAMQRLRAVRREALASVLSQWRPAEAEALARLLSRFVDDLHRFPDR